MVKPPIISARNLQKLVLLTSFLVVAAIGIGIGGLTHSVTNVKQCNFVSDCASSITCAVHHTFPDSCLPLRIGSINGIPPDNGNLNFTIINGTGITVTGLPNGLIISNGVITNPQLGNTFFAGSSNGTTDIPHFRSLNVSDLTPLGMTDGQLIIGSTGGSPVLANLINGSNIVITNTPGGILISASINASAIGTVFSVGLSLPVSLFTVSGSPITTTGTLTGALINQTANTFFAAPNGTSGIPTFRTIATNDLTSLGMTNGQLIIGSTGGAPVVSSLSAGTGITITPGSGTITITASGGGGLASSNWIPSNSNYFAWSYDPFFSTTGFTPTTGTIYFATVYLSVAASVSNISCILETNTATFTAGGSFCGIYNFTGNLVATTASLAASWQGAGSDVFSNALVGAPFALAAGRYYLAVVATFTPGSVVFAHRTNGAASNAAIGNVGGVYRQFQKAGPTAALPATTTPPETSFTSAKMMWLALS